MSYKVELTRGAKNDLLMIAQYYVSKAGIEVAKKLVDTIEDATKSLGKMPERGHKPHELYQIASLTLFEIITGNYRIIYKLLSDRVVVIAIFDGRQDVKAHLRKRLTTFI